VIKGKRKNLSPEENLQSILNANVGLPSWRQVIRRPRRRVAIAYYWLDDKRQDVWAEFQLSTRLYKDSQGQFRFGAFATYRRQREKPKGGFIADGRLQLVQRPSGEFVRVRYMFPRKPIRVPEDVVIAFRGVWNIEVNGDLINQAYQKWKEKNEV
jgi:hypothetical protein